MVHRAPEKQIVPLIVLYLPQEWSAYVRRPHWEAVARRCPVLAVEPPAALLQTWRHSYRLRAVLTGKQSRKLSDTGVTLYRPLSLVSFGAGFCADPLAAIDRRWIGRQIRTVIAGSSIQFTHLVTCIVKIQQHYMADAIASDLLCYEVTDEVRAGTGRTAADQQSPLVRRIIAREIELLQSAHLVVVSSEALRKTRSLHNANVHYLPNSADYEFFAGGVDGSNEVQSEIACLPLPRLMYVGGVNDLIDIPLLTAVAVARPEWSLVLVGEERGSTQFHSSSAYRTFRRLPNVHLLGHRPYETIPALLRGASVCLLPFVRNLWMEASSPNKMFQYLAAGKPVVSTDFPEARRIGDAVGIASDTAHFIALLDCALTQTDEHHIANRRRVARENSTDNRAARFVSLVTDELKRRAGGSAG